jgi:Leucine-rich repeat (LRR) protein
MEKKELLEIIQKATKTNQKDLDLTGRNIKELPPEIGQLKNLTGLYLSRNQLNSLPPEIGRLKSLKVLILFKNQLSELPMEIGQLANLRDLNLYDNNLSSLPAEIGQLTELAELDLSDNKLTDLPEKIGQLTNLKHLYLRNNKLSLLPSEIRKLMSLIVLNLPNNQLAFLPPEIGQLMNLNDLDLFGNQLSSLPPEIGRLMNLKNLDLSRNQLTSLPPEIGQLMSLNDLDLSRNQLRSLPPEIGQLTNLTGLYLSDNQLTSLPAEVGQLMELAELDLSDNKVGSLPEEIWQLENLIYICLSDNQVSLLPEEIRKRATEEEKGIFALLNEKRTKYRLRPWRYKHVYGTQTQYEEPLIFGMAVAIIMDLPKEDDGEDLLPLWLKFDGTPQAADVATAISSLDNLAALIRVFHKEMRKTPVYSGIAVEASPWHEKERQEEEDRLVKAFDNPIAAINPCERLAIYRAIEGSVSLGLGKSPKWLWSKLKKLWDMIPDWKRAKGEFDKNTAEARKTRSEAEKIDQETKTIGPKSEVEIAQEWEKLRKMEQDRLLEGLERRIKLMEAVLKIAPPECKTLPPRAVMTLLNKLMSTLDDASTSDHLGSFLTENEMKRLPPIQTQEVETDDPEEV